MHTLSDVLIAITVLVGITLLVVTSLLIIFVVFNPQLLQILLLVWGQETSGEIVDVKVETYSGSYGRRYTVHNAMYIMLCIGLQMLRGA